MSPRALLLAGLFSASVWGTLAWLVIRPAPALAAPTPAELRARLPYVSEIAGARSMEPELYKGDFILIEAAPYGTLAIGARVLRMDAWRSLPVAHVIIRNAGTRAMPRWVTQGINNPEPDRGWMLEGNFVGLWRKIAPPATEVRQ